MMTLAMLQAEVRGTLLRSGSAWSAALATPGRVERPTAAEAAAHERLTAAYPALARLLGATAFTALARGLLEAFHAAEAPGWIDLAERLPRFVRVDRVLRRMPYLGDLAGLELAIQHAAKARPARPTGAPPAIQATLRLRRHPAWSLHASAYPVFDIWRACQADGGKHVTFSFGGEPTRLLIGPGAGGTVVWQRLSRLQLRLLRLLEAGGSAAAALRAVGPADEAEALRCLQDALASAAFLPLGAMLAAGRQQQPARPVGAWPGASGLMPHFA